MSNDPTSRATGPRRLAALVLAALCVLPAGCGIAGTRNPVVLGDAPRADTRRGPDDAKRPGPEGAIDGHELVLRYLKAAAWANEAGGDPEATKEVVDGVRRFFTDAARRTWLPGSELTLVRAKVGPAVSAARGSYRVEATLSTIGVLTDKGAVEPAKGGASAQQTYEFHIAVDPASNGLRIDNPPPGLLLSDDGLNELYDVRPIYFWDTQNRLLVPDLRYLPKSVDEAKRPKEVVSWLLAGPSSWLAGAVNRVPDGIELRDLPFVDGQRPDSALVVNLTAKAAGLQDKLPNLVAQMRWSLRPFTGPLQLRIEGQQQPIDGARTDDYLAFNPTYKIASQGEPDRYCVANHKVEPAQPAAGHPPPPVLGSPDNSGVLSAAMNRNQGMALVREDGKRQRLWLLEYERGDPGVTRAKRTDLVAASMSRPVWLAAPTPAVLVAADGRLRSVTASGDLNDRTPAGLGPVTAVAVAPDGRRVALIAGGRVYVSTLLEGGGLGPVRELRTDLTEQVGVAWSSDTRVAVAGRSGTVTSLVEVSIDDVTLAPLDLTNLTDLPVSRLVGFPQNPTTSAASPGYMMIEASGASYSVFSRSVDPIHPVAAGISCLAPFFVE